MAKENYVNQANHDIVFTQGPILALSDGRAGNVAMAEGLAQAVAAQTGAVWNALALDIPPALVALPPRVWSAIPASLALRQVDIPDAGLVIGAGRRVAPLVAALERTGRARGVQILDSGIAPSRFAAVVTPSHDVLTGANVIATLGSVNRISPAMLAQGREEWRETFGPLPAPRIAVLLGGSTKRRPVTPDRIEALADDLTGLGGSLLVTASRRTGEDNIARLRAALPGAWFWDGTGPNPYAGMLAWADAVIVSDDSVNMISEAASCPAPVAIWPLLQEGGKIAAFRDALCRTGAAEAFTGRLPQRGAPPLTETAHAAREVVALLTTPRI